MTGIQNSRDEFNLEELLQSVTQKQSTKLFENLKSAVCDVLTACGWSPTEEELEPQPLSNDAKQITHVAVKIAQLSLKETKRTAPDSLFELLSTLHNLLFFLASSVEYEGQKAHNDLANEISLLCETWWHQDRPNKEQLTPQTISYLLIRALQTGKPVGKLLWFQKEYSHE